MAREVTRAVRAAGLAPRSPGERLAAGAVEDRKAFLASLTQEELDRRAAVLDGSGPASTYLGVVAALARQRRQVETDLDVAVRAARRAGATWTALGLALGVSPQAVQKRYGR